MFAVKVMRRCAKNIFVGGSFETLEENAPPFCISANSTNVALSSLVELR